ncbi:MAG: proline--tRNA ligase [Actinomycetota bacterium]
MRLSQLFARTLRDAPADAEAPSHQLLARAAYVRQVMAGVYAFLPLGLRTLDKVADIVREEMDRAGAQEVLLPILAPAEPWKLTGRWDAYGPDMFKLRDRHERDLGLTPTHEEVLTPIVAAEYSSYRDLPVNLYQVQWKYRDEPRPRSGILRGREFLMKDAYSFDRDVDGLKVAYAKMVEAYKVILDRCGLTYRIVEADPGLIGGDVNHEFMAVAEVGEDLFVHCSSCEYAANVEAATAAIAEAAVPGTAPLETVRTPGRTTIRGVTELLGLEPAELLKSMAYQADGDVVLVLVPGDRDVDEGKLRRLLAPAAVRMLDDDDFANRGLVKGFVGPQGLDDVRVIADHRVNARGEWVAGANEVDQHATGVVFGRDFEVERFEDLAQVREGDPCPRCGGDLKVGRSIEVGHTFQLGTRYSVPLEATFTDEDGSEQPLVMGCYGIGVTRVVAAIAEQHNDEHGLAWPKAVAPFGVVVVLVNRDDERVVAEAERIYAALLEAGIQVALDDRESAAGVKFNDADLIGFPVQVVVGKRGIDAGQVDIKVRATGEKRQVPVGQVVADAITALEGAP